MTDPNRRRFLQTIAAGAAVGAQAFPPVIQKALAVPARRETGTLQDVKHVVILMQENRSFDHYFGTLKGVRGFGDPRPPLLPNGQPVWNQPNNGSVLLPYHPDTPDLGLQFLVGTPHDWKTTQQAWNQGRYDQWIAAKGPATMAYFQRQDIPFHCALADAFTVCDAYHCSLLGPTDPNRYHLWTGWVGNDGSGGGPVIDNAEAGYGWSTYPEKLQAAGISWKIYQDVGLGLDAPGYWGWTDNAYIGNYGDNSLLYFHQYQNAQPGTPLYDNARTGTNVTANPSQSFFDVLKADVAAGRLPQVSWIVAPEAYSEHPNWPPNYGAWYISQVLEILTSNEELWSQTVLLVTYDENDGFFDHMLPPVPPMSRDQGLSTVDTHLDVFPGNATYPAGPYGLGQRVPMLVVSPWSRGGWVCSQVFDHTSVIRFLEQRFGIAEPNITPWRRAVCGDLTSAFDFRTPNDKVPALPSTTGYLPPDTNRHPDFIPVPPANPSMPRQEQGLRWSRPLPYQVDVQPQLDAAHGMLTLQFVNSGQAGAVFQVRAAGQPAPRSYTVEAGKRLSDSWSTTGMSGGQYDLIVWGPDGFYRHLHGDAQAAASGSIDVEVTSACVLHGGAPMLSLSVSNRGQQTVRVSVSPNAYTHAAPHALQLAPGQTLQDLWPLKASAGWYDLSVTVDGSPAFLRRLAGRVHTGRASISDPAILTA
jgi:phospholipase C